MSTAIERLRDEQDRVRESIAVLRRREHELGAAIAECEGRPAMAEWLRALSSGAAIEITQPLYLRTQAEIVFNAINPEAIYRELGDADREAVRVIVEQMRAERSGR